MIQIQNFSSIQTSKNHFYLQSFHSSKIKTELALARIIHIFALLVPMKHFLIVILLTLSIAGPLTLGLAAFELRFFQLKENMESRINRNPKDERIQTLIFSKEESKNLLKWEHSREFEYQGEMYDVLEIQEKGDYIEYLVWHDREESKLKRSVSDYERSTRENQSDRKKRNRFHVIFYLEKLPSIVFWNSPQQVAFQENLNPIWDNPDQIPLFSPPKEI